MTNEYRHGTIMTTFLAEPRRVRVLAAKLAAALIGGVVTGAASLAATAAVAIPWASARGDDLPIDGQALEAPGRLLLAFALSADVGDPDPITPYLPGSALNGIVGGEGNEFMLRGGWAALLALAYVAGLSLLGALSMTRRDP